MLKFIEYLCLLRTTKQLILRFMIQAMLKHAESFYIFFVFEGNILSEFFGLLAVYLRDSHTR